MVSNISQSGNERINQSFTQIFNNLKPTIVTFYNINNKHTTLDPGLHNHYTDLGDQSPLRFTKINNLYLYGIGKAELNAAYGDFGVEAAEISGSAYIMPNLFDPYVNAYFSINYMDRDLLFKVISVTPDTLYNGANWWKIEYKLDQHSWEEGTIDDKVVEVKTFKVENYGTEIKALLDETEETLYDDITGELSLLKEFFTNLFYDRDAQTFVFLYGGDLEFKTYTVNDMATARFYDPFMIEFLIRSQILSDIGYTYIDHKTILSDYFKIEYNKSVFTAIENRRLDQLIAFNNPFCGLAVEEPTSILSQFYHTYYQMTYSKYERMNTTHSFFAFDAEVIDHIKNNELYTEDNKLIYNVLINYFNGATTNTNDFKIAIERMDFINNKETFYLIPFVIYIMTKMLSTTLKPESETTN